MNRCTCGAPLPPGYTHEWHAGTPIHWSFMRALFTREARS